MNSPRSVKCLLAAAALAVTALAACAQVPRGQSKDIKEDLNEPTLYEFLLGEIALQRGDAQLAGADLP
jgi:hypothetical protein